jgi:hypothetical protein
VPVGPRRQLCDLCRTAHREESARARGRTPGQVRYDRNRPPDRYNAVHKRLRKVWAAKVEAGHAWCARCGGWIPPGSLFDLDHDDTDRSRYIGVSHQRCNRQTSIHRAVARRIGRVAVYQPSPDTQNGARPVQQKPEVVTRHSEEW